MTYHHSLHIPTGKATMVPKLLSLNEVLSRHHFTTRKRIDGLKAAITLMLNTTKWPEPLQQYKIHVEHNTNLDNTNLIMVVKVYEDLLCKRGVMPNDNKQYGKGLYITPTPLLDKGVINIYLEKVK